jgi:hypothetical protein
MPYGNLDKRNGWFYACLFWVVAILVCAAIGGLTRNDTREFMDGYRRGQKEWYGKGYAEGYKKASDEAVEVVERQISEIENRLTNH